MLKLLEYNTRDASSSVHDKKKHLSLLFYYQIINLAKVLRNNIFI